MSENPAFLYPVLFPLSPENENQKVLSKPTKTISNFKIEIIIIWIFSRMVKLALIYKYKLKISPLPFLIIEKSSFSP